jgi:alpha-mannosidase
MPLARCWRPHWRSEEEIQTFGSARSDMRACCLNLEQEFAGRAGLHIVLLFMNRVALSACSHMDLAWLWPIRETMRKSARTCATVLENMERYSEYKFGMSQPQQLVWIKEKHPEMFKRIQQRVAEGRWECQGCMWVEPDTNLTGGESLIRQTMHGQRFWKENFGTKVNHLWEPDVFGYSAAVSATSVSGPFPMQPICAT